MKCKAIIFDLDGTLLYTLGDIVDAVNRALSELGFPVYKEHEYRKMVGYGLKEVLRRAILPDEISPHMFADAYVKLLEYYSLNCTKRTTIYDEVPELLNKLTTMNLNFAVLSNKEDELVQKIAVKLLIPQWDFFSIQGTKPDVPKKPDPSAVHKILKDMDVKPSEAIFIGDSGVDMKTAINSGLLGVGVTWGYRDIVELTEAGADILIDKPGELLRIIESE